MNSTTFNGLNSLAAHLRSDFSNKKFILLYAYNGTGKTRLSTAFKNLGKHGDERDTLYFNAFTEDLFSWDNDLEGDAIRVLKINNKSRFFSGLDELEMDNRIRPLLNRYADFDFTINTLKWNVSFSRELPNPSYNENAPLNDRGENPTGERTTTHTNIKISRGEENIFIWCFFLAIVQLALDRNPAYLWVKYIYIDDPISSLDEPNAIAVANHLAQSLTKSEGGPRVAISTHHVLFFNVMCNELKNKARRYFLKKCASENYILEDATAKPFLHHLSSLVELYEAQRTGNLYTHHFNMMRRSMEQTSIFFGLDDWKACIKAEDNDPDRTVYKRLIDLMSHGDYSLYEPREMMEENKRHFRTIFRQFVTGYPFNPTLFPAESSSSAASTMNSVSNTASVSGHTPVNAAS